MAGLLLLQRAQGLIPAFTAQLPQDDREIIEIGEQARGLPADQAAVVDEIFLSLAQAQQFLEHNRQGVGVAHDVEQVAPPIPYIQEQLIPHQQPRRVAVVDAPARGAPPGGPGPVIAGGSVNLPGNLPGNLLAPLVPFVAAAAAAFAGAPQLPAPHQPVVPIAPSVPAQEPTLIQKIITVVSKAFKDLVDFAFTFLCCLPGRTRTTAQQPAVIAPTNQAQQPIVVQPFVVAGA